MRPSIADPRLYADVNVLGTINWLEAASRLEPRPRFVYASSSSVYGDRDDPPFRETDPVDRPVSPYAATKSACELMAHTFHHLHGLPVTGLRFFTAYGPRNRPDLAIAKFTRLIDRGEPVPMFGDGTTRRDYTYVDDIVDGIVRAIERCSGAAIYNLGRSDPIALREMIDTIAEALGKPALIQALPEQPGDVRQTFADVSLAARELGYCPRRPVPGGDPALHRLVPIDAAIDPAEPRRGRVRDDGTGRRAGRKGRPRRVRPGGEPGRAGAVRADGVIAASGRDRPHGGRRGDGVRPSPSAT